jgi:hypothetical protein
MLLELLVAESLGARLIHNLATPSILTPHTVSIIACAQKVSLDTHTANLQITKGAINLFVIGLVEALAAYSAVAHLTYLSRLFLSNLGRVYLFFLSAFCNGWLFQCTIPL